MSTGSAFRVGVFVFDDAEELDVVGPYEVLATWAALSGLRPEVLTFSADGAGVRLAKGLRIVPERSADDVVPLHVLVYPGGRGTRTLARDPAHLAWLRGLRAEVSLLAMAIRSAATWAARWALACRRGRPARRPGRVAWV